MPGKFSEIQLLSIMFNIIPLFFQKLMLCDAAFGSPLEVSEYCGAQNAFNLHQ